MLADLPAFASSVFESQDAEDTEVRFLSLTREQKNSSAPHLCALWFRIRSSTRGRPSSRRSTLLVIKDGRAPAQFQTVTIPLAFFDNR